MQIPVPVVRLIISDVNGKILILKRANTNFGENCWCLPGGNVDYGKTVVECVAKELMEETSLKCLSADFLFYQDSLPPKPGMMHCINFYFECTVSGEIKLNDESSAFAWINESDFDKYTIVFWNDEAILRYWKSKASKNLKKI